MPQGERLRLALAPFALTGLPADKGQRLSRRWAAI